MSYEHTWGAVEVLTFHRTHRIRFVDDDHIDVGQLQPLQTRLHALDDVLARQAALIGLAAPVDLRCDHVAGALPAAARDDFAQLGFCLQIESWR